LKAGIKNIKFICNDLDHPEGLAFDLQGKLYAGGELGQIYRINVESGVPDCIAKTGGFILGITLDGRGRIYACDAANHQIIQCMPNGQFNTYAEGTDKILLNNPNFSAFDNEGRMFFSDSGNFWKPSGRLWIKEPGIPAIPLTSPELSFPNGIYLDSEEEYLYIVLSTVPEIARFKIKKNSLIGGIESVVKLPSHIIPDGISIDSDRNLWIACYKPDEILKVSQKGKVDLIMEDPSGTLLNRPTNIVLKENEVFFTNFGGRHIGSFKTEVEPLKLNYPVFKY
jgi:gluconolactonase